MPTIDFKLLFVFLVLAHERRRVLHFNVTEHPTAEWTAMQLGQAFPWDTAPRYLLRDRDRIYGNAFRIQTAGMQITEVLTAPQAPWQSPYVERLIGSIRRECLDHVIIWVWNRSAGYFNLISPTTTIPAVIYRSPKIHRKPEKFSCPIKASSSRFQRSVGFNIVMNDAQPEHLFVFAPVNPRHT